MRNLQRNLQGNLQRNKESDLISLIVASEVRGTTLQKLIVATQYEVRSTTLAKLIMNDDEWMNEWSKNVFFFFAENWLSCSSRWINVQNFGKFGVFFAKSEKKSDSKFENQYKDFHVKKN